MAKQLIPVTKSMYVGNWVCLVIWCFACVSSLGLCYKATH